MKRNSWATSQLLGCKVSKKQTLRSPFCEISKYVNKNISDVKETEQNLLTLYSPPINKGRNLLRCFYFIIWGDTEYLSLTPRCERLAQRFKVNGLEKAPRKRMCLICRALAVSWGQPQASTNIPSKAEDCGSAKTLCWSSLLSYLQIVNSKRKEEKALDNQRYTHLNRAWVIPKQKPLTVPFSHGPLLTLVHVMIEGFYSVPLFSPRLLINKLNKMKNKNCLLYTTQQWCKRNSLQLWLSIQGLHKIGLISLMVGKRTMRSHCSQRDYW